MRSSTTHAHDVTLGRDWLRKWKVTEKHDYRISLDGKHFTPYLHEEKDYPTRATSTHTLRAGRLEQLNLETYEKPGTSVLVTGILPNVYIPEGIYATNEDGTVSVPAISVDEAETQRIRKTTFAAKITPLK